jgi:glucose-6-phosphate-specific signal transduction histidine kinase
MSTRPRQFLYWAPRILTLRFAVDLSLIVFGGYHYRHSLWVTMPEVVDRLVPAAIVLLVLALAWRWEWVGGIVFAALGIYPLLKGHGDSLALMIFGNLFAIALLFTVSWVTSRNVGADTAAR